MKIIINDTNKPDDVPLRVAIRLINKGKAHLLPEIPFSDYVPSKETQKIIDDYSEKQGWPIKEKVIEVDVIEPIPEQFVSFNEPKEVKTIKKVKNKII